MRHRTFEALHINFSHSGKNVREAEEFYEFYHPACAEGYSAYKSLKEI